MRFIAQVMSEIGLGWRRATRGALLLSLLGVMTILMLWLPAGAAEPLANTGYAMAFVWTLLLLCALWSGVASYAYERECHRMALVFTKPLTRWTLWVGRWLGTTIPFLLLLLALALLASFTAFPEGHKIAHPQLPEIQAVAQQELQALVDEGMNLQRIEEEQGVSQARLLLDITRNIQTRYTELEPQKSLTYTFAPRSSGVTHATFCLHGTPFLGAYEEAMLTVTLSMGEQEVRLQPRVTVNGFEVDVPREWNLAQGPLQVELHRAADFNKAGFILFREREDVQLRYEGYSPMLNLLAAILVIFCVIAMASALGCALGSLFSLPVALFVGTLCLLAAGVSAMESNLTVTEEMDSLILLIGARASEIVAGPFQGLLQLNPLNRLQTGQAILFKEILHFTLHTLLPWVFIASALPWLSRIKDEDR